MLSSDPQQNLGMRNPTSLPLAKPDPSEKSHYPQQTLFWAHGTGTDVCSPSTQPPPKGEDNADCHDYLHMGLVSGRTRQGGFPLLSHSDTGHPRQRSSSSEARRGWERGVCGTGSSPGQTWLEMSPKPSITFTFSFCVLGQLL